MLRDRPLSVIRVLRGQKPFMQKNVPKYAPAWVETVTIWAETSKRDVAYALCNDRRTLLWFANQRAIEYHPTLARADPTRPPDPPRARPRPARGDGVRRPSRGRARSCARRSPTSGWPARSRPAAPRACTSSCRSTQPALARRSPRPRGRSPRAPSASIRELATTAFIKEDRDGKVFVDSTRVGGATVVAAYSPRVRPGVPVSFPVVVGRARRRRAGRLHRSTRRRRCSAAPTRGPTQMPEPAAAARRADRGGPRDPGRPRAGDARGQAPRPRPAPAGAPLELAGFADSDVLRELVAAALQMAAPVRLGRRTVACAQQPDELAMLAVGPQPPLVVEVGVGQIQQR